MIIVVVGKHRNTTPWFSAVGEKTARTKTENRTNCDRRLHEPQPQTARPATANRTHRHRKPHEPQRNRSVNLFLGSTVDCKLARNLECLHILMLVAHSTVLMDMGLFSR
jgi:ribosomal protein S30